MAHIVRDWRTDLIEAHPDLFHPLPGDPGGAGVSGMRRGMAGPAGARVRPHPGGGPG
jgi:hypothetical protein